VYKRENDFSVKELLGGCNFICRVYLYLHFRLTADAVMWCVLLSFCTSATRAMRKGAITGFAGPCCVSVGEFICVQMAAPLRRHYVVLIVKRRHSCGRFASVIVPVKAAMMIKRKQSFILIIEQLCVQECWEPGQLRPS
jgi:hypothetical protein